MGAPGPVHSRAPVPARPPIGARLHAEPPVTVPPSIRCDVIQSPHRPVASIGHERKRFCGSADPRATSQLTARRRSIYRDDGGRCCSDLAPSRRARDHERRGLCAWRSSAVAPDRLKWRGALAAVGLTDAGARGWIRPARGRLADGAPTRPWDASRPVGSSEASRAGRESSQRNPPSQPPSSAREPKSSWRSGVLRFGATADRRCWMPPRLTVTVVRPCVAPSWGERGARVDRGWRVARKEHCDYLSPRGLCASRTPPDRRLPSPCARRRLGSPPKAASAASGGTRAGIDGSVRGSGRARTSRCSSWPWRSLRRAMRQPQIGSEHLEGAVRRGAFNASRSTVTSSCAGTREF
jgi:hypothetical protein